MNLSFSQYTHQKTKKYYTVKEKYLIFAMELEYLI